MRPDEIIKIVEYIKEQTGHKGDIFININNNAIPIEWMQQMIEEGKASGHIDEYGEYQEGTTLGESCEHVLANWYNTYKWKWEKENADTN